MWEEANDFSYLAKPVPCPLCGKSASPTIIGDHFKCETEGHIFNKDGSELPEEVKCYCDKCRPAPEEKENLEDIVRTKLKRGKKGKKK